MANYLNRLGVACEPPDTLNPIGMAGKLPPILAVDFFLFLRKKSVLSWNIWFEEKMLRWH
jgi:hypothetical protein